VQVSPPPGHRPHITRKAQPTTRSSRKESLHKTKGRNPTTLYLSQRKNTKSRRGYPGGRERERGGRGGSGGREHRGGKSRGGDAYEGGEPFKEREGGPEWCIGTDVCHAVEEARPAVLSRGAGLDVVLEGFRFQAAAGAGGFSVG